MKKSGNILPLLVAEYLKNHPRDRYSDIYTRIGMSKQNFHQHLKPDRELYLSKLIRWKDALLLPDKEFWSKIQSFYDR